MPRKRNRNKKKSPLQNTATCELQPVVGDSLNTTNSPQLETNNAEIVGDTINTRNSRKLETNTEIFRDTLNTSNSPQLKTNDGENSNRPIVKNVLNTNNSPQLEIDNNQPVVLDIFNSNNTPQTISEDNNAQVVRDTFNSDNTSLLEANRSNNTDNSSSPFQQTVNGVPMETKNYSSNDISNPFNDNIQIDNKSFTSNDEGIKRSSQTALVKELHHKTGYSETHNARLIGNQIEKTAEVKVKETPLNVDKYTTSSDSKVSNEIIPVPKSRLPAAIIKTDVVINQRSLDVDKYLISDDAEIEKEKNNIVTDHPLSKETSVHEPPKYKSNIKFMDHSEAVGTTATTSRRPLTNFSIDENDSNFDLNNMKMKKDINSYPIEGILSNQDNQLNATDVTVATENNTSFVKTSTGATNKQQRLNFNDSCEVLDENKFNSDGKCSSSMMEEKTESSEVLQQEIRFLRSENALYKEQIKRMAVPEKVKLLYRQLFSKKRKLKELEEKLVEESLEKERIIAELKGTATHAHRVKYHCNRCDDLDQKLRQLESANVQVKEFSFALNESNNINTNLSEQLFICKETIATLERNKTELLDKIETISNASKEREVRLEMYKFNYNSAKEELNGLQVRNRNLAFKISQIDARDDISIYKKQCDDLNDQLANVRFKLEDAEMTVKTLNDQLNESKALHESLQTEKSILQKRLSEISTLNSKITSNNSEFQRVMKEQITKTKDLEQKHQERMDEASRVRNEITRNESRVQNEINRNKVLTLELDKLKNELKNETLKAMDQEQTIRNLLMRLDNEKTRVATLSTENNVLKKEIQVLESEKENLRTDNLNLMNSMNSHQNDSDKSLKIKNDFAELKNEKETLNLYLNEILAERMLTSSVTNDSTLLDKLQAICVQLNRIEWRKTNSENKVEKLEGELDSLREKVTELSDINATSLQDKEDFLALLEKQNREIKLLRSMARDAHEGGTRDENEAFEQLQTDYENLKHGYQDLNDLLESMVNENQELKAQYLELGLTGYPLISPPVQNKKVDENETKKLDARNYEKLYDGICEENLNLKECIKKYRAEVESMSDLLESVVVENRRLKLAKWDSPQTNC